MVDQRRIDNQPTGPTRGAAARTPTDEGWLDAAAAAALLGIQRRTLYAYVSRGAVRSVAGTGTGTGGRARRYAAADLARLKARRDARLGHGAVAAGALRWGEPVLDSAITAITPRGPAYRGHLAVDLAAAGVPFENVAELLWSGELAPSPVRWPRDATARATPAARTAALGLGPAPAPLVAMAVTLAHATAVADPGALVDGRGRALILDLAACVLAGAPGGRAATARRARAAPSEPVNRSGSQARVDRRSPTRNVVGSTETRSVPKLSVAAQVAVGLGLAPTTATIAKPATATTAVTAVTAITAINRVLVLLADHELNASSFAARVAASTGAAAEACLLAALATLSGPRHGTVSEDLLRLLAEIGAPGEARAVVRAYRRAGKPLPGFGHTLYVDGDPRAAMILADAAALDRHGRGATLRALIAATDEAPNVDAGLAALVLALGLPPTTGAALFAVARSAGWLAHAREQRAAGFLLRPRARYVGPAVRPG